MISQMYYTLFEAQTMLLLMEIMLITLNNNDIQNYFAPLINKVYKNLIMCKRAFKNCYY